MIRYPAWNLPIKKGDGVVFMHDGVPDWGRFPPAESLGYDERRGWDAPPFSHTGHHHAEETGDHGVGHQIEGAFQPAPHGGHMFVDHAGGVHFHGMDALIHDVGEYLSRRRAMGLDGPPPSEASRIIQLGIDKYNEDAADPLPPVDADDWRQIGIGKYQGKGHDKKMTRRVRGADGRLATTTTNLHGDNHHLGTFLESSANYAHLDIAEVLADLTNNNPTNVMNELVSLKYPYIYAQKHSFRTDRNTGKLIPIRLGLEQGSMGTKGKFTGEEELQLQSSHFGKIEGTSNIPEAGKKKAHPDRHEGRLSSYGMVDNLPDEYFMDVELPSRRRSVDTGSTHGSHLTAKAQILEALGAPHPHYQSHQGETLPADMSHLQGVTWTDPETGEVWPMEHIVTQAAQGGPDEHLLDKMLLDFNSVSAFHKVLGRTQDASAHTALDDAFASHPDNQERGHLSRDQLKRHGMGQRVDNPGYLDAGAQERLAQGEPHTGRWRTHNLHNNKFLVGNFASMHASGLHPSSVDGNPVSNFRHQKLKDAVLEGGLPSRYGSTIKFDNASRERAPERRAQIGSLANLIMSTRKDLAPVSPLNDADFSGLVTHHDGKMTNMGLMGTTVPAHLESRMVTPDIMQQSEPLADAPVRERAPPPPVRERAPPPPVRERTPPPPPPPRPVTTTPPPAVADKPVSVIPPVVLPEGQTTLSDFPSPPPPPPPSMPPVDTSFTPTQAANQDALASLRGNELVQVLEGMRDAGHMPHVPRNLDRRQAERIRRTIAPTTDHRGRVSRQPSLARWSGRPVVKSDVRDRITKTLDRIQILEALSEDSVMKHIPTSKMTLSSEYDVGVMARKTELTNADVRAIVHSAGDWERVAKAYSIPSDTVKVIKVAFRGD